MAQSQCLSVPDDLCRFFYHWIGACGVTAVVGISRPAHFWCSSAKKNQRDFPILPSSGPYMPMCSWWNCRLASMASVTGGERTSLPHKYSRIWILVLFIDLSSRTAEACSNIYRPLIPAIQQHSVLPIEKIGINRLLGSCLPVYHVQSIRSLFCRPKMPWRVYLKISVYGILSQ